MHMHVYTDFRRHSNSGFFSLLFSPHAVCFAADIETEASLELHVQWHPALPRAWTVTAFVGLALLMFGPSVDCLCEFNFCLHLWFSCVADI